MRYVSILGLAGSVCFATALMAVWGAVALAQAPGHAVSFASSAVDRNEAFEVNWTAPADRTTSRDWIGIYRAGTSDTQFVTWQYIPDGEGGGTRTFTVRQPGTYEVRMFSNNGYERLAEGANTLTVRDPSEVPDDTDNGTDTTPPAEDVPFGISVDRSTITPGESVRVTWTAPRERSGTDWVGVYRTGSRDTQHVTWQYVPRTAETTGVLSFAISSEGTYEMRMFRNNGYTRATSDVPTITVARATQSPEEDTDTGATDGDDTNGTPPSAGAYSVSFTQSEVARNEAFTVSWTAPADRTTSRDWIGIYRTGAGDRQYLAWQYIPGSGTQGELTFRINREGTYEARLFTNNGYTRVARSSQQITVRDQTPPTNGTTEPGNGETTNGYALTPLSTSVPANSTITINWEAPAGSNLNRDWIGVYRVGAGDRSPLAWQYVSEGPSGTVTFTGRTPGTYEFRYFKNNGYTRVAVSPTVVVEPEALPQCPVSNLSTITNFPPRNGPIIAFGDSLTAGVGASMGQSFPSQLARRADVSIVNAGISGDTTRDALERLERDVLERDPSVVIVWLGGNDILQRYYERVQSGAENPNLIEAVRLILLRIAGKLPEPSGITEDETFENLTETIERIQARGAVTIVIGFSGGVFDTALEQRYAQVAQATGSLYVPNALGGVIGRPSLMSDLVHPNNVGYGIVADRVLPYLACTL